MTSDSRRRVACGGGAPSHGRRQFSFSVFLALALLAGCAWGRQRDPAELPLVHESTGWVSGLIHALDLARAPHPSDPAHWMADTERCGIAVNRTLQILADEYLDHNVDLVLQAACEHSAVFRWFGGSQPACEPHFESLEAEFDGERDYTVWCEDTLARLADEQGLSLKSAKGGSETGAGAGAGAGTLTAEEEVVQEDVDKATYETDRADHMDVSQSGETAALRKEVERLKGEMRHLNRDGARMQDGDRRKSAVRSGHADHSAAESMEDEEGAIGAPLSPGGAGVGEDPEGPSRIGVDTDDDGEQPFGGVRPFGNEATGQKLTESSMGETNGMVDQIERAEVAEERRAVYRSLTRLRGAAISAFDGIAREHTANIDHYAKTHKWRDAHPMRHLAQEEDDVEKWAFPDGRYL